MTGTVKAYLPVHTPIMLAWKGFFIARLTPAGLPFREPLKYPGYGKSKPDPCPVYFVWFLSSTIFVFNKKDHFELKAQSSKRKARQIKNLFH